MNMDLELVYVCLRGGLRNIRGQAGLTFCDRGVNAFFLASPYVNFIFKVL